MAHLLLRFMADPEGDVSLPAREAIEWARSARDFEAMLAHTPSTHSQRLAQALNLIDAVLASPEALAGGRLVGARNAIEKERAAWAKRELNVAASTLGRHPPSEPPPLNPELVAGVMERATVPRYVLLSEQRTKARRASEGDDDE